MWHYKTHTNRGSRRNKMRIYMASEEKNSIMTETKRRNSWILHENKQNCKEEYNDYYTRNQGNWIPWMNAGTCSEIKTSSQEQVYEKKSPVPPQSHDSPFLLQRDILTSREGLACFAGIHWVQDIAQQLDTCSAGKFPGGSLPCL